MNRSLECFYSCFSGADACVIVHSSLILRVFSFFASQWSNERRVLIFHVNVHRIHNELMNKIDKVAPNKHKIRLECNGVCVCVCERLCVYIHVCNAKANSQSSSLSFSCTRTPFRTVCSYRIGHSLHFVCISNVCLVILMRSFVSHCVFLEREKNRKSPR